MTQKQKHKEWVETEGGLEHPTKLETLMQPEQQRRIKWLKKRCNHRGSILDIGCNWGYILNEVNGTVGVDINPENITLATQKFPDKVFHVMDIVSDMPPNIKFDIVILADILEHLEWQTELWVALWRALSMAKKKVLITLPWRADDKCALCFKHKWIPSAQKIGHLIAALMQGSQKVTVECDGVFVYIEVIL